MCATPHYDVLIVGAGHGGTHVASSLRQHGFSGAIGIVGDESELPYERPPLSKEYLAGERSFERILIRPAAYWDERSIRLLSGQRATAVDLETRSVTLSDGQTVGYGKLVWAAGGRPRQLACEGAQLQGIHVVRTKRDVDRMVAALDTTTHVVVIGGGYIGLEAAAVLNKLGKHVTVLEVLPRVLARVAGEPLSRFYEDQHRAHGVDVRLGRCASAFEGTNGHVVRVRLDDGETIPAQMVVVGIGIVPEVAPLIDAGAAGQNGVDVDQFCQTSLPDVFAIGDCAAHVNHFADGARIRLESVQNATDQATTVVKAILGDSQPYQSVPWFWSNQYDLKLQTVGLSIGHDDVVLRGCPAAHSFSVVYLRRARVIALDCVNATKDYVQGRKLVVEGRAIARSRLADVGIPLKEAGPE